MAIGSTDTLKVTQVQGHSRSLEMAQIAYEFVFHYNYGHILYRFRDKARRWSINDNFSYLLPFNYHDHLESLRIYFQNCKTNCPRPSQVHRAKLLAKVSPFEVAAQTSQTDRETDRQTGRQTTDRRPIP